MKTTTSIFNTITILLLLCTTSLKAQNLSLNDLQNICSKSNWELSNQYLINKKWAFDEAQEGDTDEYSIITWAFNKNVYSKKAEAWVYLYTYEAIPVRVVFNVFNQKDYSFIVKSLNQNGYKIKDNKIKENEIIAEYESINFILEISTKKKEVADDNNYNNNYGTSYSFGKKTKTITSYTFFIIKKSSIYDPNNGKKIDYWQDGKTKKFEYNLKNGEIHGKATTFFENGKIDKEGNYINGKLNGEFTYYNEQGIITARILTKNNLRNGVFKNYYEDGTLRREGIYKEDVEHGFFKEYDKNEKVTSTYTMKEGKLEGLRTTYEEGKKITEENYSDGMGNGKYIHFSYNEGEVYVYTKGNYKDDKMDGVWKTIATGSDKEFILKMVNYDMGVEQGKFQEVRGDSLIFGNFQDGYLEGEYIVYIDYIRKVIGGVTNTDTTNHNVHIASIGNYYDGYKNGKWKHFDIAHTLTEEGNYIKDKKDGKWKYYYGRYMNLEGEVTEYSGKLYLEENYSQSKYNGQVIRHYYSEKKEVPCRDSNSQEPCYFNMIKKCYRLETYKNGVLNGKAMFNDSLGIKLISGNYENGNKQGFWQEVELIGDNENESYLFSKGDYVNDKKNGSWKDFFNENSNYVISEYKNGQKNGISTLYYSDNQKILDRLYEYDDLKKINIYDEVKENFIVREYILIYESVEKNLKYVFLEFIENNENEIKSTHYKLQIDNSQNFDGFSEKHFDEKIKDGTAYPFGIMKIETKKGVILEKGRLNKDTKTETWEYNFPEQQVKLVVVYDNEGKVTKETYYVINSLTLYKGNFVFLDKKTNIKEERKIKDGLRDGNTKYFNSDDKLIKKEKYKDGILK